MITESARCQTLKSYGILDTPNDPDFDLLVRQLASAFRVTKALVSFIDADRQWYKARVGVAATQVPRAISFCTHSIEQSGVTVVLDALADPRFRMNPFVTSNGGVRFYAAAPIKAANRARIGTVCIFDTKPRAALSAAQQAQLEDFAARVVTLLDERRLAVA